MTLPRRDRHVFTPARISVRELLASQAAISLENARLYTELQLSEDRWRNLFESAPVGVTLTGSDGRYVAANQTYERHPSHGSSHRPQKGADSVSRPRRTRPCAGCGRGYRPGARSSKRTVDTCGYPPARRMALPSTSPSPSRSRCSVAAQATRSVEWSRCTASGQFRCQRRDSSPRPQPWRVAINSK
jgi:hypothetical protein